MQHNNCVEPTPIRRAISHLGAINKLAVALGVTSQAVRFWRDGLRQLPADKCPLIERLTDRTVKCEQLRPDVDWAYIRNSSHDTPPAQANPAHAAIETIAPSTWTGVERRSITAQCTPNEGRRETDLPGGFPGLEGV